MGNRGTATQRNRTPAEWLDMIRDRCAGLDYVYEAALARIVYFDYGGGTTGDVEWAQFSDDYRAFMPDVPCLPLLKFLLKSMGYKDWQKRAVLDIQTEALQRVRCGAVATATSGQAQEGAGG